MSEFAVEISRPGDFGALTSATLELPASQAEYHDAMQKARITDNRVIYSVELCGMKRDFLRPHIPDNMNLLELNLLAIRMDKYIGDDMDVFEAMVKIEAERVGNKPIPLPRLINLTFSTKNCYIAGGIKDDASLGRFLFENDMLPEEVRDFAAARIIWGSETENERFALIGARHCLRENGVFTRSGRYVEFDGSVNEVYVPHEMAYFENSDAPVVLEISKGYFNDPGYDNELKATLPLPPLSDHQIADALEKVDAASVEEIGWRCTDCLIPVAKGLIDDTEDLEAVGRFAKALADMQRYANPAVYKAMLEAVKPPDLEAAISLAADIDQYTLNAELSGPEDYSREILSRPASSEGGPCGHQSLRQSLWLREGVDGARQYRGHKLRAAVPQGRRPNFVTSRQARYGHGNEVSILNFFEKEPRKLFADSPTLIDPRFTGRVCLARLTDTTNVKLEFVTLGYATRYEGIKATVLNCSEGQIDATVFRFADILGKKSIPNNPNFREGLFPYAWEYNSKYEWYAYQPTPRDYELIADTVNDYLEMFGEPIQTQGMRQQMR